MRRRIILAEVRLGLDNSSRQDSARRVPDQQFPQQRPPDATRMAIKEIGFQRGHATERSHVHPAIIHPELLWPPAAAELRSAWTGEAPVPTLTSSSRALQVRQHFIRVPFCFYVIEDVLDLAVGAYDESCSRDAFHFLAVHVFLFDHAEQVGNFLLRIGQQGERQTELVLKLLLRGCCVRRNSEQHHACLLDCWKAIAKTARFLRA